MRVERFGDAIPLLKECLAFELDSEAKSNVLSNLGLSYTRLKNYEDAKNSFVQALEIGLTKEWEGQVHCQLGIAYAHLNLLRESKHELLVCVERAAEYQLPMESVYGWLAWVCNKLGQKDESERYTRMARPI